MGHHVAAADKRRIALLSNYEATPASIKAAPSGCPASAAFRSTNEEHFSREDFKSPYRALRNTSESLVATVLSSSGMTLLIVMRYRDILKLLTKSGAKRFTLNFKGDISLNKKIKEKIVVLCMIYAKK